MKKQMLSLFTLLALAGCHENSNRNRESEVVSQRYIHKYGYDVSPDEWQSNHYPGQVITTMRNGVTITSTYDDGILDGQTTYTHPHSQTLESVEVYSHGTLAKKTFYDVKGLPEREEQHLSPSRLRVTSWYKLGSPRSVEEYQDQALVSAEYLNTKNECEARITNGFGDRITRSSKGHLISSEKIEEGFVSLRKTFHENGTPRSIITFAGGTIHGEKRVFAESGEPVSVEAYVNGQPHGSCSYYQNGTKYLEVSYNHGFKHGPERFFMDGTKLIEENQWIGGKRHGQSIVYLDGQTKREWFYNNDQVSKNKYNELLQRERDIAIQTERANNRPM